MQRKKIIIAVFISVAIAIWGIVKYRPHSQASEPDSVWVEATTAKQTSLPLKANTIGTLVARSVEITSEVSGHVERILFHDGSFVKQGTPLIQLDDAVYKAKNSSAKAQLHYSKNNFERMTLLGKQGAIAKQAIDQADADFKEKRATAEESEVMVNKMKLLAPFDGTVGQAKINPGDYVNVGQSMVTITDTKHLRIEYNIPEEYLSALKLGQEVKITTTTYPGRTFLGKLAFISPTINTVNRSISLYADLTNDENLLAAGMFVNVTHLLGTEERVLMIPSRSLVPILDGAQVYKVMEGKAYAVTVSIGKRIGESIQISQGLAPGDIVITDGQLKLKNGASIKIKSKQ
jgi:membrane fusion protein, multidrug efflux system